MSVPKIKLTYFDIKGAAEPVRLALVLSGIEFEDDRINGKDWPALKEKTKFGQLPLMTIGEGEDAKVFAQSGAMLRWVGDLDKANLYPKDPMVRFEVEEMLGLVDDMAKSWSPCLYIGMRPHMFGYAEDFAKTPEGQAKVKELREKFLETEMPKFATFFSEQLKKHGGFLCTKEHPTLADCALFCRLESFQAGYMDHVPTDSLDKYPDLVAYMTRMRSIPQIKAWHEKTAK